jgi:hypothetical protein
MLRRRLLRSRPIEVARLSKPDLVTLARRARDLHATLRGPQRDPGFDAFVEAAIARPTTPRDVLRGVIQRLESAWWATR